MSTSSAALKARQRVARHRTKLGHQGLTTLTVVIPRARSSELHDIARHWRHEHLAGDQAAHTLPAPQVIDNPLQLVK